MAAFHNYLDCIFFMTYFDLNRILQLPVIAIGFPCSPQHRYKRARLYYILTHSAAGVGVLETFS